MVAFGFYLCSLSGRVADQLQTMKPVNSIAGFQFDSQNGRQEASGRHSLAAGSQ